MDRNWAGRLTRIVSGSGSRFEGAAEDFAGIAVYLTSDASAYHTGDTFIIDGGYNVL